MAKQPERALDRALRQILTEETATPMVYRAARKPGTTEVVRIRPSKIQDVREQIIRIQQDADPIGFMIAVQQGAVFEVPAIVTKMELNEATGKEEPIGQEQIIIYESPTLKQRLEAAKFLANKVLPTLTVQQIQVEDVRREAAEKEDARYNPMGEPGQPSFAQVVQIAASKAQEVILDRATQIKIYEPVAEDGQALCASAGAGELPDDINLTEPE